MKKFGTVKINNENYSLYDKNIQHNLSQRIISEKVC